MILSLGLLGILWRGIAFGLLILLMVELRWAQQHDGKVLASLRAVFASFMFVLAFPLVAAVDAHTDISPGFRFAEIAGQWVWLSYAVLSTSLVRFWLALHGWARGKDADRASQERRS